MNSFTISELEKFSGIKAHTIRAWELRYGALKPNRSSGNTRSYDGTQLRRLLNITSLLNSDHKVMELCSMSDEELFLLLESKMTAETSLHEAHEYFISQIIAASINYDEPRFDKLFSNAVLRYGIKGTYVKVIYPTLVRLGLMWSKNELQAANEHFITSLIRQKILAAIDALPPADKELSWVLFLPDEEYHETGLLIAQYLIRQAGHKVYYLGSDVNIETLDNAINKINPDRLLFFLVRRNNPKEDAQSFRQLNTRFPDKKIYVACDEKRSRKLTKEKEINFINSVTELEEILSSV